MSGEGLFDLTGKSLQVVEQFADCMPGGFFIYKAEGGEEIIYANRALLDIFGCRTREEFGKLTGNTFKGLVHPDDIDKVEASISEQIHGSAEDLDYVEYRIIRRDGSIRFIEDYGHFVRSEEFGGLYYVFVNDATERHLREQSEREREINRAKMNFLFNISHDIRTPMNSIVGFTDLARRHINEPELLSDYLGKVELSNRHMMSLIDDILEMSSIESGRIRLSTDTCVISEQINAVVEMMRPRADEKHITLETDIDLPERRVTVDGARFRRILSNLIGNAVKFTPENGTVRVKARAGRMAASGFLRYEISVFDNGIGMSREFLTRIFRPFEREATSTESGYPGSGLGLSITKSLIDLMGGTVEVSSVKGGGSVFHVSLAFRPACEAPEKPAEAPAGFGNTLGVGKRILLAEDIEINRILAETVLRKFGYTVESAVNGREAVNAVSCGDDGYFDIVLMDIQMPVMNGYDAAHAIRTLGREYTANIPIVALSANVGAEDKRLSAESGMNAHIAKPFDVNELIGTIRKLTE